jgi:hypothetical protein
MAREPKMVLDGIKIRRIAGLKAVGEFLVVWENSPHIGTGSWCDTRGEAEVLAAEIATDTGMTAKVYTVAFS